MPHGQRTATTSKLRDALGLRDAEEAMRIVERYVPVSRLRIQTRLTVESLFE